MVFRPESKLEVAGVDARVDASKIDSRTVTLPGTLPMESTAWENELWDACDINSPTDYQYTEYKSQMDFPDMWNDNAYLVSPSYDNDASDDTKMPTAAPAGKYESSATPPGKSNSNWPYDDETVLFDGSALTALNTDVQDFFVNDHEKDWQPNGATRNISGQESDMLDQLLLILKDAEKQEGVSKSDELEHCLQDNHERDAAHQQATPSQKYPSLAAFLTEKERQTSSDRGDQMQSSKYSAVNDNDASGDANHISIGDQKKPSVKLHFRTNDPDEIIAEIEEELATAKGNKRNALQAKLNREKKKIYISSLEHTIQKQNLEKEVLIAKNEELTEENKKLHEELDFFKRLFSDSAEVVPELGFSVSSQAHQNLKRPAVLESSEHKRLKALHEKSP